MIVDLSAPEGRSVDDGIQASLCSLLYVRVVDTTWEVVAQAGGAVMAKVDVRSAYCVLSILPADRWVLGMLWDNALFIDASFPFGLRSAPTIFRDLVDVV